MPNISLQWDENASLYDQTQGEAGDPAHQLLFDPQIAEMLGDLHGKVILDAGSGNGYWVRRLAKQAEKVIGIDASPKLIEISKKKNNPANVEYKVMDILSQLTFEDKYFGSILS